MNEREAARSHAVRMTKPAAGEPPHALRDRLKDAEPADTAKLRDEREELQAAARARQAAEPPAKRRRGRRAR
ncbi:MAG TPA: hypothetical protein VLA82_01090 [Actinomycetota bacterium]|nr:hypothetical protein [Actinomycetota bacterium]